MLTLEDQNNPVNQYFPNDVTKPDKSKRAIKVQCSPSWCCSMGRALARAPKGFGFNSQSGAHTWVVGSIPAPCGRQSIDVFLLHRCLPLHSL